LCLIKKLVIGINKNKPFIFGRRIMSILNHPLVGTLDIVRKSLNTLEECIFEYYELLKEKKLIDFRKAA